MADNRHGLQSAGRSILGESQVILDVKGMITRIAPSHSTVLICGESGTGKELVAEAIYKQSSRASAPFVVIDCTALQESLLESELFGHERGAYTSATNLKYGLLEAANSGVVLLDEIGELSLAIQAKLLRAIETGTFRRVGSNRDIHVDVRVLAATNRDLEERVKIGQFREDLFYRLNVVSIHVPPLRARVQDIPHLVRHFVVDCCKDRPNVLQVSDQAMDLLMHYTWPGNVRELRNTIERAVLLCRGDEIAIEDLPGCLGTHSHHVGNITQPDLTLKEAEQRHIIRVLRHVGGHRAQAAEVLGISPRQLYRKIRQHHIK